MVQAAEEKKKKVETEGGYLPPDAYRDAQFSAEEDALREMAQGPLSSWLSDHDADRPSESMWLAKARRRSMASLVRAARDKRLRCPHVSSGLSS